jgi:phosphate-selective porin OprO and OprP
MSSLSNQVPGVKRVRSFLTREKTMQLAFKMPKPLMMAAVVASLFGGLTLPAHSADMETLIEKLKEKGVLSEGDAEEMRTEARAVRRKEALRDAQAEEKTNKAKEENHLTGRFRDGFSWESADKENSIAINGRIHADYRQYDVNSGTATVGSNQNPNTFDLRRAYLGVSGKIANDWTFEVVTDVAQTAAPQLDVAWVNWGSYKEAQIRAGQFKMPMALEELTSSRFIDFTERSFVDLYAPAKERGMMLHGVPFTGGFYGIAASNGTGKNNNETSSTADGKDLVVRLGVNAAEIMGNKDMVLHFAGAISDGKQAAGAPPSARTEGRGLTFFTPGTQAVNYDRKRTALEASLAWNQFKLQAESMTVNIKPDSGTVVGAGPLTEAEIKTHYAEALWLITGEKYADAYRGGAYGAIKPNTAFKKGADGWGAFEVGVRFSKLDADDFAPTATSSNGAKATTIGLKWIANTNTRVYLNHINTKFDQPITVVGGTSDREKAYNVRFSIYF